MQEFPHIVFIKDSKTVHVLSGEDAELQLPMLIDLVEGKLQVQGEAIPLELYLHEMVSLHGWLNRLNE